MRNLIYKTNKVKVYKDGEKYELFAVTSRNMDGFIDTGSHLVATYTPVYMRDNFGRTTTWPHYNRNNESDYAYKAVLQAIETYENK